MLLGNQIDTYIHPRLRSSLKFIIAISVRLLDYKMRVDTHLIREKEKHRPKHCIWLYMVLNSKSYLKIFDFQDFFFEVRIKDVDEIQVGT